MKHLCDSCIYQQLMEIPANQCSNCGLPHSEVVSSILHRDNSCLTEDSCCSANNVYCSSPDCISNSPVCVPILNPTCVRKGGSRESRFCSNGSKRILCEAVAQVEALQREMTQTRKTHCADERNKCIEVDSEHENRQEHQFAIIKQHKVQLIEAANRRKLVEEQAVAVLKQRELEALERNKRTLRFQAAKRRRDTELSVLEWRRQAAEQAAEDAAIKKRELQKTLQLIQDNTCSCSVSHGYTESIYSGNQFGCVGGTVVWKQRPSVVESVVNVCPSIPCFLPPKNCDKRVQAPDCRPLCSIEETQMEQVLTKQMSELQPMCSESFMGMTPCPARHENKAVRAHINRIAKETPLLANNISVNNLNKPQTLYAPKEISQCHPMYAESFMAMKPYEAKYENRALDAKLVKIIKDEPLVANKFNVHDTNKPQAFSVRGQVRGADISTTWQGPMELNDNNMHKRKISSDYITPILNRERSSKRISGCGRHKRPSKNTSKCCLIQ